MKSPVLLPIVITVAVAALAACNLPSAPAVDPNQSQWFLQGDANRNEPAVLNRGDSIVTVVDRLGRPRRKEQVRGDAERTVYYYDRYVQGPMVQHSHNSVTGIITVREFSRYVDHVTIVFKSGALESVTVDRRTLENSDGVPVLQ